MLWLYRILSGFLKVRFYGENKEKILSICASNGIALWNSKPLGEYIESYILIKDFRYLRRISKGKGIRVHILSKIGVPFITERYKKRIGILVGAVIFFLILELMSGYIWIIDINGNEKVTDREILSACEKIGIHEGIRKNSIYPKVEREKLLLNLDKIAWGSLNIEGCRLSVNVTETKETEKGKIYSNLKSDSDGIIKKMDIVSGTSVVKVGDAVKKGDLLVSGIIETADETRFINSKGNVTARVRQEVALSEAFKQKKLVPNGEFKTKYAIEFLGLKTPLYLGNESKLYKSTHKVIKAELFGQNLPVKLYKKKFEFQRQISVTYNFEELCKRLEEKLIEKIEEEKSEKYVILEKEFSENNEGVTLNAVVELEKNIVYEDILLINAGN